MFQQLLQTNHPGLNLQGNRFWSFHTTKAAIQVCIDLTEGLHEKISNS